MNCKVYSQLTLLKHCMHTLLTVNSNSFLRVGGFKLSIKLHDQKA